MWCARYGLTTTLVTDASCRSPTPLDRHAEARPEQGDAGLLVVYSPEGDLGLQHGCGPLAETVTDVAAGPQQVAQQLHLVGRPCQLVPELQERGEGDLGGQRPVEARAEREDIAARRRDGARSVEGAGPQPAHLPAVHLEARAAERQVHRRVREGAIADDVVPPTAQVVGAARRVDERPAKILAAAERTLHAEPGTRLSAG